MANLPITTLTGVEAALGEPVIEGFAAKLRGELLRSNDPAYEEVRLVWNGLINKRPALIVRCVGVGDVIDSVNFAREHDLLMAVRGGGHNVAGYAVCDGGLVIDLSLMKGIWVDHDRRTVRVQGGATWGDLDRETQVFGLATPGGEVSITGIAGLTLSGGMGYLRRKYGLSCDNLISADIVTATGEFLTASEAENTELFWAIRGGGGNFGVVTSFEYQLHPVGPEVMTISIAYPLERAEALLRTWRDFVADAPDEATTAALALSVPAVPDFPEELHDKPIIVLDGMYAGSVDEGERAFAALRELGEPLFDLSGPTLYTEAQSAFDGLVPDGDLYYWKSLNLNELSDDFIGDFPSWVRRRPSPRTAMAIRHLGGAVSHVPDQATAYANRNAQFNLSLDSIWDDPTESERNIAWTRQAWTNMRQFSEGGIYLNFAGFLEEGEKLLHEAHGENYGRLVAIKNKYDPTNLFRLNQNIKPSE